MAVAEALLHLDAEAAVRAQLDEVLTKGLKADYLQLDDPVVLSGTKTGLTARVDRTRAPIEFWDITDALQFEYTRLDLAAFTSGLSLAVGGTLPLTGFDLMTLLLTSKGIPVSRRDGTATAYTSAGKVTLAPGAGSYRWTGTVGLTLSNLAYTIGDWAVGTRLALGLTSDTASETIKARLATQLNQLNATRLPVLLTEAMFTTGTPVSVDDFHAPFNTELALTFTGGYYTGTLAVRYNRFSFEQSFVKPIEISGTTITSSQQLVPDLSKALGCIIRTADVKNTTIPSIALNSSALIAVTFVDTSLAYQGELMVKYTRTG